MKKSSRFLAILVVSACLVFTSLPAFSGSTIIHIETETGGCVRAAGTSAPDCDNLDGAMFWNGTGWGVNDTYGHMYFMWLTCDDPSAPPRVRSRRKIEGFRHDSGPVPGPRLRR
jgi:hypothetical protein